MKFTYVDSPLGDLLLAGQDNVLHTLGFPQGPKRRRAEGGWQRDDDAFAEVKTQLAEYFAGQRREFNLALLLTGTEFQVSVLEQLQTIPYGDTWSYGGLAQRLGRPKAVRAVGTANGRNPIPIIVPCHRVIGQNGTLTGFGGGLAAKRLLLELEGAWPK